MSSVPQIVKTIITNVLTALYQPFWFALILSVFLLFFYMYCYCPADAGKGWKAAAAAWVRAFKKSSFFRRLFFLCFCTVLILFRTLLNRNLWLNPLSNVMGGWWIWKKASDGTMSLTTECFENLLMMLPFTFLLLWTAGERWYGALNFRRSVWLAGRTAFVFSLSIELLQLILRLGTFQLSDLFYNTLGGVIGGALYWAGWRSGLWGEEKHDGAG